MLTLGASPVAKLDLDQPVRITGTGRARLSSSDSGFAVFSTFPLPPQSATAQNIAQPLDRPRPAPPGEHQAGHEAVAASDFRHLGARHQRLLDDPRLVVLRPAAPPLESANTSTRVKGRLEVTRFAKYPASDKAALVARLRSIWLLSTSIPGCIAGPGRNRHAGIFPGQPAVGSPDGADAGTRRPHQKAAKDPSQHRGPR